MGRRTEIEAIAKACELIMGEGRRLKMYQRLSWPKSVKNEFLKHPGTQLPKVEYPKRDYSSALEATKAARALLKGNSLLLAWMRNQVRSVEATARMLSCLGKKRFLQYSTELFGQPRLPIFADDERVTPLILAKRVRRLLANLDSDDMGSEPEQVSAEVLASRIQDAVVQFLGDDAPEVVVVPRLRAKATAARSKIRINQDARFTKEDVEQLVMHEAMVHVTTTINGSRQKTVPVLGLRHARTVRTQEGLAVFSEMVSGAMGPSRLLRLARRNIAIDMALNGADFIDVFAYFREFSETDGQAFDDSQRIFRGGVLTGGAPFTKDGVYLDGLVRVHAFLGAAIEAKRPDVIPLLFCGKLDIDDIPAIAKLSSIGALTPPQYLAPWAQDRRFVVSYLAYSGFLQRLNSPTVKGYHKRLLDKCVPC